jgi:cysteine synthase A
MLHCYARYASQLFFDPSDDQAKEKYQILEALGATIEKVRPCSIIDANHYVNIARQRAKEQNAKSVKGRALFCNQFENEANYQVSGLLDSF